jgi:pimeloyl-ACP methyl ester carboxylesterase
MLIDHLLRPNRSTEIVWDEYAEQATKNPKAFQNYALSTILYFPLFGPIDELILERLRNHPQKILLIWGTADGIFNCRYQSGQYLRHLPQIQLKQINGGSHYVYIDKNHECVDAILQFLKGNSK